MKIVLDKLTKSFKERGRNAKGEFIAVNEMTLTVPDGKLIALLGPSGCGKSTTLNMICGLLEPTSGRILFGDEDVTKLSPQERGVGMVFQNYALYPHLTVLENICFPLENLTGKDRLSKEEMKERALKAASLVEIEKLLDRKPAELSGGQQQRVAIARALVKEPKVLLLDEPLSNLDARLRLATREEIRNIQKSTKVTTIFVTHDQDEAMSISDEIVVMKDGVVRQSGQPQAVYDDPKNLFVAKFLGTPPINIFAGEVSEGMLSLGDDKVCKATGVRDGKTIVGIRPEGFVLDENGPLKCEVVRFEVQGRDASIIAKHPSMSGATVRIIVDSDTKPYKEGDSVSFSIKKNKLYIFDAATEERLYGEE